MIKIFKSKTIIFSILLAIFGVLELHSSEVKSLMSPEYYPIFTIFVSTVIAVLRVLTTKPLNEK